jgi:hypothetical protein
MKTGWENHEAAPLEFFHGKLMDYFHEWRETKTENTVVEINGIDFNNIIAKAKKETYAKYPKQISNKAILKSEL